MPVFTMTMFTIAQVGKQPRTHQWRNGFFLCHTDTQWDVFQPLKKKEINILPFETGSHGVK